MYEHALRKVTSRGIPSVMSTGAHGSRSIETLEITQVPIRRGLEKGKSTLCIRAATGKTRVPGVMSSEGGKAGVQSSEILFVQKYRKGQTGRQNDRWKSTPSTYVCA